MDLDEVFQAGQIGGVAGPERGLLAGGGGGDEHVRYPGPRLPAGLCDCRCQPAVLARHRIVHRQRVEGLVTSYFRETSHALSEFLAEQNSKMTSSQVRMLIFVP